MTSNNLSTPKSESPIHATTPSLWNTNSTFMFALCAFLGILLLIFSELGFAQPSGFQPGSGAPPSGNFNDDDFDEFDDFSDVGGPSTPPAPNTIVNRPGLGGGNAGGGSISVGGSYDNKPGPELQRGQNGFQLSGPGTQKGMKSKNELDPLTVDTESGDGIPASTEMITDFNFPEANVMDIAKTLGRLTGKNFILDKDVAKGQQTVTIISNSPITVSDAWRAFLTALDMHALAIVPSGKYLRIMRQNDAKGKNVRMYSNKRAPNTDALVTKIFKIKYISAKELENVVRTYANMGARIYGFEQTNTLIITDTGSNIDKIAKMIAFLDVEGFDAGIEVVQVKYASAVELQKLIDQLLPGTSAGIGNRPGFAGGPGGGGPSRGGSGFSARRTKEGGIVNTIIADERTNTMIVHANTKGAEQVRQLVARLDRKMPMNSGSGKVHVVYLQFADAEDMAKTLSNFSQGTGSSRSNAPSGFPGGGGVGVNPNEGALFEGQVKVSPDKATNSLVVTSSPNDFATLQRVINKLDIPRDQVYVEVVIMEMNMSRNNDFAANILMPKTGVSVAPTNDLKNLLLDPTSGKGLILRWQDNNDPIKINLPGSNVPLLVPNMAALLKAIQTYDAGNVLATPQLMALDNAEATFESSDQIPFNRATTTGIGVTQNSIETKDIPLLVKIKPQLNKISNFIKLEIDANISDVSNRAPPKAVEDQFPATLKRQVKTTVVVADTDTVVLGGLTRDKVNETITKVPLLGDIPVLGWLFKSRSASISKTNLMLFITPKIVRQYESIRQVLDAKLKERDEFVDKAMGGEDPHRDYRNKMIRSLPDIKDIKNYNARGNLNLNDEDAPTNDRDSSSESLEIPAADPVPKNMPPMSAPPFTAPDGSTGGSG